MNSCAGTDSIQSVINVMTAGVFAFLTLIPGCLFSERISGFLSEKIHADNFRHAATPGRRPA